MLQEIMYLMSSFSLFSVVQLDLAEECLSHATDLSGLLLLYFALGDAKGMTKLASLSRKQGKNNVTFL